MQKGQTNTGSFRKGVHYSLSTEFKKGSSGFTGKHTTDVVDKMRLRMLGKPSKCIGQIRPKISGDKNPNWQGGKPKCIDCAKQLKSVYASRCKSCAIKKRDPELIASILRRRPITQLEQRVLDTITKHNLPYKFVGDGKFMIERKNPDFINTNGKKIAVEVYSKRHKDQFRVGGESGWKKDRIRIFKEYGWDVLFIDAMHADEKNILSILKGGK